MSNECCGTTVGTTNLPLGKRSRPLPRRQDLEDAFRRLGAGLPLHRRPGLQQESAHGGEVPSLPPGGASRDGAWSRSTSEMSVDAPCSRSQFASARLPLSSATA